jgi:PAS domain S-box-containing protein
MKDKDKTQQQLIKELTRLRRRIAELEATGSKRNQFEESRRTERDKAQQYLDIAEVMLVVLDKKGTITLINRKGNQILGYKEGELLGKNWFTTCLPTHLRKNVRDVFKKLMAGEGKQTEFYENPVLTKSGPELIIAWHNTLLKDAQGNIIGTLSSGMDITERKQAEAALRESEQRYRELFEGATEGILFVDLKSKRFLYANPSMCNMLGYSEEELRNLSIKDIHPRESWKHVIFEFEAQARGEKSLAPAVPCMRKDGTIFYADITTSKISINNKECNVGFFTDITERKEAEEALQESEARFRTLFEGIPDSILVHDDEGTILHINEIGAQQLEWSVKDLMGRNLREIVTPDNAVSIADHIRETLKLGWCRFETTYVSRSGWQVIAEATERPIKLGNAKAILSVAHDITERKRTEEALRESEERFRKFADEATFEGIIIHDEGKILDVNKQFSTMHGYERAELMGMDTFKTIAPESREIVLKHIQEGYEKPYEAVALKKHGSAFPIEIHSKIIPFHGKMVRAAAVRDITERKQAEEALRTSEAQLSNAMEIAKLGYWEYDVAEDIFTFNDHFYELFRTTAEKVGGYKMSSEQYAKQFVHPDDISLVGIEIRKAIETTDKNFSRQLDHRIIYADGEIGYISVRFFIVKDSHGRTVKTYGANQDITERKRAEESLRESEDRFRRVVETMEVGLGAIDENGVLTYVNEYLARMLGYSIDEMIGRSTLDFYYDEQSHKEQEEIFKKRKAGLRDPASYEVTWRRKDGQKVYSILSPTPMFDADGHYTGSFAIHTDITERKRMEEILRESEEKYRELINGMNDTAWVIDFKGKFVDVNDAAVETLGYSREELFSMGPHDIDSSLDPEKIMGLIKRMRTDKLQVFETTHTTKDGKAIPVEIKSTLVTYQGKEAILSIARDITDRKQAELELQRSYELLRETLISSVNALASTIEKRDPYTAGHQKQATILACAIATEMELPEEQIEGIRMAGLIHDIGKIMVPAEILSKPGPLSEIQFDMVKMHPQAGYDILTGVTFPWPVAEIVLQHHERLDGSGYPRGLSGEKIMLEARILAAADVVEAMSSYRPYRPSLGIDKALEEISQNRGILYDPEVVDACIRLFTEKGFTFREGPETGLPP